MSKSNSEYGLKFENKIEACVERLKSHHIFLTEKACNSVGEHTKWFDSTHVF